jgi:hypothetical protein
MGKQYDDDDDDASRQSQKRRFGVDVFWVWILGFWDFEKAKCTRMCIAIWESMRVECCWRHRASAREDAYDFVAARRARVLAFAVVVVASSACVKASAASSLPSSTPPSMSSSPPTTPAPPFVGASMMSSS